MGTAVATDLIWLLSGLLSEFLKRELGQEVIPTPWKNRNGVKFMYNTDKPICGFLFVPISQKDISIQELTFKIDRTFAKERPNVALKLNGLCTGSGSLRLDLSASYAVLRYTHHD